MKIFFQGTFDILNACHTSCFNFVKGDLIIGLNTDSLVKTYKKRSVIIPYSQRKKILESIKQVVKVVPCDEVSCMKQLKKIKPDIYILGKEWKFNHSKEISFVKSYGGKIVYTPTYTNLLHSSDIKKKIYDQFKRNTKNS